MENNKDFQEEYKKLDEEAAKYNRREFDLVYEIISEMVKGWDDVGDNGNIAFPLVEGEIIDEAIKRAGFSKDEAFASDFKKYREIEQKAKSLQLLAFEQAIKNIDSSSFDNTMQKAGFVKSTGLQSIMDNVISKTKEDNPYFPYPIPYSDEKKLDEELDLLLGSRGYNITGGWLRPYFDELIRYKVDELLNKIGFPLTYLLKLLRHTGENIENNSDKSIMLENSILDELNRFNKYPGSGQVIQLLFLLGVIKWFEGCDISEGDKGYNEAKHLLDHIASRFIEIYVYYSLYINKDEHSKPLDEFLANDDTLTPFRLAMESLSEERDEAEVTNPDHSNNHEINDYNNKLDIPDRKEEEKPDHSDLLIALKRYITGISPIDFTNIIEHHSLTSGTKAKWKGSAADAHRFATSTKIKVGGFNKCFEGVTVKGKLRPLNHNDNDKNKKNNEIDDILKAHLNK